ncbi:hypothetical protein acsn021_20550 [Anaerocolumna cellulosilytica]|uniref:Uncharacterized protein n=1 Tax=Anaerocolumna cellulosilytica TaxID=433286 RepID=A0A6S6QXN4_9FIRM|nr:hypothetical protein [Anaerocolumna cellulosilytica]MBB5194303.1 hypothetical protein [Anaerocolumna cellulosilytica]BCJ94486.1 hypothetical protein acsn021_20550 [Anaerocolumna cellulosilytica]
MWTSMYNLWFFRGVFLNSYSPLSEFMTWDFLGSMAGAIAATTLIVQFLKFPLDKVWKIHTRYVVYLIALLLLVLVEVFTGHINLERFLLLALNAVIVATSSMGTYEVTFKQVENAKAKT